MTDAPKTHAEKASALQVLEEAYKQQGTLTPTAIEYLLEQAQWSLRLDSSASAFLDSTDRYVALLRKNVAERDAKISELLAELSELRPERV